jgi:hypothetical protein
VTLDRDFGELVYSRGQQAGEGIVLVRLRQDEPDRMINTIVSVLLSREDWTGHYTVIEADRIPMRELPVIPPRS